MTYLISTDPILLSPGDRMSRHEFLARWQQMPNLKRAELIDGVVYMPSAVSFPHARQDSLLQGWATVYESRARIVQALTQGTYLIETESAPQPDLSIRLLPEFGGQSGVEGQLCWGAPEFVAEVVLSSRAYDLGPKLALYERAGVREYLAVLMEEQRLEWRILRGSRYELLLPDREGTYRSEVFPGLWLNEPAFWAHDGERVFAVLEEGVRSPEFVAFKSRSKM